MASLGRNAEGTLTATDILRECIAVVRRDHPDADVNYDHDYFGF
jgi:hypothetical protein